jgi:hypothetical protein
VAELFFVSEFCGDPELRAGLGLILVEERGEAEHIQGKAFRIPAGDDQIMDLIASYPSGTILLR